MHRHSLQTMAVPQWQAVRKIPLLLLPSIKQNPNKRESSAAVYRQLCIYKPPVPVAPLPASPSSEVHCTPCPCSLQGERGAKCTLVQLDQFTDSIESLTLVTGEQKDHVQLLLTNQQAAWSCNSLKLQKMMWNPYIPYPHISSILLTLPVWATPH